MRRPLFVALLLFALFPFQLQAHVGLKENQLTVDGVKQPMLFGAELQYFRLRGGYGPNQPRAKVIELWDRALDHMVAAKMNAISFYIPWDFHEYAEGKFDFTGTIDQDGDGNPDYPSRDLQTFFKMIDEHGIKRIMVRPGPYINAEWGFLGFGAVPQWFHQKYPSSHMQTSWGWNTKLYDYHNPDFLEYSRRWFTRLYTEVLKDKMGPGKPIAFLQVDNETNFQWQSLYSADYGPGARARYRDFLRSRYSTVAALNAAHARSWASFDAATPPTKPGQNNAEDQDWYRFQDWSIFTYLQKVRAMWEDLGVREPQVLFTLAESYNAPGEGLFPNFIYRNAPGQTGMMTVNLYPKTYETLDRPMHNLPFKADLDVLSADEANDAYVGRREEWVLGPEVQGGWWKGIEVNDLSRQQTYLTTVGQGMKALFIYYFNEGYNWGVDWAGEQIRPVFEKLRRERGVAGLPLGLLSNGFWGELQALCDRTVAYGLPVRDIIQNGALGQDRKLFFDAPLDADAHPRDHYEMLRTLGEKVFGPYGDFLARSTNVFDAVALVKDNASHVPSPVAGINNVWANADWAGGVLGWLQGEGVHPRVLFGDMTKPENFASTRALFHLDTGVNALGTTQRLQEALTQGKLVVNLLASDALKGIGPQGTPLTLKGRQKLSFYLDGAGRLRPRGERGTQEFLLLSEGPFFSYELRAGDGCVPVLYSGDQVVGHRCQRGAGTLVQIGALAFDDFNNSSYTVMPDPLARRQFLQAVLKEANLRPLLGVDASAERFAAFARTDATRELLWITVKTATRRAQDLRLRVDASILPKNTGTLEVRDLLRGDVQKLSATELVEQGLRVQIGAEGSTVFTVKMAR